jgi:hypothetical protein
VGNGGQALVAVGGNTAGLNVPPILVKRDLVLAVRRIAPASIEPSPALFRDVTSELKTVLKMMNMLYFVSSNLDI